MVSFANGEPVAAADNTTAAVDIFANIDNKVCPDNCFRPVGLAFDSQGRLFMSSDATGEIYVIVRDSSTNSQSSNPSQRSQGGEANRISAALSSMLVLFAITGYLVF
jgi:hypothetical protein